MLITKIFSFQAQQSALSTILKHASDALLPDIVETCMEAFNDPQIRTVSKTEFGIMQTPDGEVYDKSILERYIQSYLYCWGLEADANEEKLLREQNPFTKITSRNQEMF